MFGNKNEKGDTVETLQEKLKTLHGLQNDLANINNCLQSLKDEESLIKVGVEGDNKNNHHQNILTKLRHAGMPEQPYTQLRRQIHDSMTAAYAKRRSELLRKISELSGQLAVAEGYTDE